MFGGKCNLVCGLACSSVPVACTLGLFALLCWAGCRAKDEATTQPAPATQPALTLIAPQSLEWSTEEAAAMLEDEQLGISAAVRLVRLAEVLPLCVPEELSDGLVRRLRLKRLTEERWALGLTDRKDERRLQTPLLISVEGDVALLAEGTEEEVLVLHVAEDADVFPHLVMFPDRVLLVEDEIQTAIVLEPEQKVRFDLRKQDGYSYVALLLLQGRAPAEVAMFTWDPYELVFLGPAIDKLPDPPGGKFHVDLAASTRMEPQGGEIPEPDPIQQEPPEMPDMDLGDDGLLLTRRYEPQAGCHCSASSA